MYNVVDMMFENIKYVIFDTSETGSLQFYVPATYDETGSLLTEATASEVIQTASSNLRLNVSGSKTFVKFEQPSGSGSFVPPGVGSLSSKSELYSHSEILNVLTGSEWVDSSMPEK